MTEQSPFHELVEAMAAPGHPDKLGVVLGGAIAGFLGALLHARGIALWLVPLVIAWMLATVVVAVHLLRSVLRQRDARSPSPPPADDDPRDDQGRRLYCPQCGGPDPEGYPYEVLHDGKPDPEP